MSLGQIILKIIDATIRFRRVVVPALQVGVIVVAAVVAHGMRFEGDFFNRLDDLWRFLPLALLIKLPLNQVFGLNHGWWRYTSVGDVKRIVLGMSVASVLIFLAQSLLYDYFSRAVVVMDLILTIGLKCGIRLFVRSIREGTALGDSFRRRTDKRVIIIGAGDAGIALVKALQVNSLLNVKIVGFLDDNRLKTGARLADVAVLGKIASLPELVVSHKISEAYIAIPSLDKASLDRIVNLCLVSGITFKTIPSMKEMIEKGIRIDHLREVIVEDLLGREPVRLNKTRTSEEILGRVVMVTGAGGSIGSEICRQVLSFNPAKIVLFERSEENLFYVERELRERFLATPIVPVIGDIGDRQGLSQTLHRHQPQLVYHAAAYKHVGMMQANPREAIKNNVMGTMTLLEEVTKCPSVKKFVNISTDKAVNPKSVMGYTKRLAEMVCQGFLGRGVEIISVRFGNVLGSSGSVVEIFREQIARNRPLTVTDREATRFFMTAHEAVELVLHACSHGQSGSIYMLDMGKPVKVDDLARRMIELADPTGHRNLKVVYTGLKDGEKLAEELAWETDDVLSTSVEKVFVLKSGLTGAVDREQLHDLFQTAEDSPQASGDALRQLVDEIDSRLKLRMAQGPLKPLILRDEEPAAFTVAR